MLSIKDCLDYCDLTDDDVTFFAEHQNVPNEVAAHLLCGMVQTADGIKKIARYMQQRIAQAQISGNAKKAHKAYRTYRRFIHYHPG